MKVVKVIFVSILLLFVLLVIANGDAKHLKIDDIVEIDFRDGQKGICLPFWSSPHTGSISPIAEKGHPGAALLWRDAGPDGHGGNIVSADITPPALPTVAITSVAVASCSGCGGHFWACPDPRCPAHQTLERVDSTHWRAWAATDDGNFASMTFTVNYSYSTPFCIGRTER